MDFFITRFFYPGFLLPILYLIDFCSVLECFCRLFFWSWSFNSFLFFFFLRFFLFFRLVFAFKPGECAWLIFYPKVFFVFFFSKCYLICQIRCEYLSRKQTLIGPCIFFFLKSRFFFFFFRFLRRKNPRKISTSMKEKWPAEEL